MTEQRHDEKAQSDVLQDSFRQFEEWITRQETELDPGGRPKRISRAALRELRRWKQIGRAVYERKFLVLRAMEALRENDVPHPLRHAATDVLVEKAQLELTDRARTMNRLGALTYGAAMLGILAGAVALWLQAKEVTKPGDLDALGFTISIVRTSTMAALIVAAVYAMIALARALLAEGALLLNRRHALRWLRLCVYISGGSIDLVRLQEMFNWNAELKTTFSDIDPDKLSSGMIANRVLDILNSSVQALAHSGRRIVRARAPGLAE